MERIRHIFPAVPQFAAPKRLLLIDFWADSEEVQPQGEHAICEMGATLTALREGIVHQKVVYTEEQIYGLPSPLLDTDCDGVVLLPPLRRVHDTGKILRALRDRQRLALQTTDVQRSLFPENDPNVDYDLCEFWSRIPGTVLQQHDLRTIIVNLVLSAIPDGTDVTIMGLDSMLGDHAMGQFRETIQSDTSLRFIVELGDGWPGINHRVQLTAVTMESGHTEEPLVRLFKVPTGGGVNVDDVVADFQLLCNQEIGATQHGYVMPNGLPDGGIWLVEANHPRWEQYLSELQKIGEVKSLHELGHLARSMLPSANRCSQEPTDWPVLNARQITADGLIDFDDVEGIRYMSEQPSNDDLRLRDGDVVIRDFRPYTGVVSPMRLAVVPETDQSWYLGRNTLLLRFHDDVESTVRLYVLAYLRSSDAADWLGCRFTGTRIPIRLLRELPVPVPVQNVPMREENGAIRQIR